MTIVRDQLGFSSNILSVLLFPISYVPSTLNLSPYMLRIPHTSLLPGSWGISRCCANC